MNSQQVLREGVVSLFNTYEFVDPKLKDFADLANGRAIQQILNCIQDNQSGEIQSHEEDNWALNLKTLKEIISRVQLMVGNSSIPVDAMKIAKDGDQDELMQLINWVLLVILKSQKSQVLIEPMMSLPHQQQIQIAQIMNQIMHDGSTQYHEEQKTQGSHDDLQKQAVSEEFLKKLEELEEQRKELEQRLRLQQGEFDSDKQTLISKMDEMARREEKLHEQIRKHDEELVDLFDKFSVSSLQELFHYVNGKDQDITILHGNIKDMSYEMKLMKENNDEIIAGLRRDLETQMKRSIQIGKLERQIDTINLEYQEAQKRSQEEHERERKGHKQQVEELNAKVAQLNEKLQKSKSTSKEDKTRIASLEFELQKSRADQTSLTRQVTLKEQEIYQLQNEISDLENALDQIRQEHQISQELLQTHIHRTPEGEKNASLASILSPKRNLGFELSQVMNRSFHWEQNDGWKNAYKNDSRLNTVENKGDDTELPAQVLQEFKEKSDDIEKPRKVSQHMLEITAKSVQESDEEDRSDLVLFWKSKCEGLLNEVNEKESKYLAVKENAEHLEAKLEKFFKEQIKYESELQQAKEALQKHFQESENKLEELGALRRQTSKVEEEKVNLLEKVALLEALKNEHLSKISQFEQHQIESKKRREERKQKQKVSSIQILEKQLKITKRSYEETLEQKNEEIQLLLSVLADVVTQDSQQQKQLLERIAGNFNMPFMLVQPK